MAQVRDRRHWNDPCLFRTPHGLVVRCVCCHKLEIRFRSFWLAIDEGDFRALKHANDVLAAEVVRYGPYCRWRLAARSCDTVSVTLSPRDVLALKELLDGAAAMLELEHLLDDTLPSTW